MEIFLWSSVLAVLLLLFIIIWELRKPNTVYVVSVQKRCYCCDKVDLPQQEYSFQITEQSEMLVGRLCRTCASELNATSMHELRQYAQMMM